MPTTTISFSTPYAHGYWISDFSSSQPEGTVKHDRLTLPNMDEDFFVFIPAP